jgi:hypothetical protein
LAAGAAAFPPFAAGAAALALPDMFFCIFVAFPAHGFSGGPARRTKVPEAKQ